MVDCFRHGQWESAATSAATGAVTQRTLHIIEILAAIALLPTALWITASVAGAQTAPSGFRAGRRVPQWAVLLQLIAHMDDYLGQTIAYARVIGVVPPWSQ